MTTESSPQVDAWLVALLGLPIDGQPFPWQRALFARLLQGEVVGALDIPTGLGKTSVMALWLAARACGAKLPRRLVYVVDRRAVVDQATAVADHLRRCVAEHAELRQALGLERDLPISTLRGQHVDNREWLEDPAAPAIIVGTVDMIGSRLLFEGYGVSRKMRPYHAGLLGVDTLVVLDEAHLVPPFERLLHSIANGAHLFGPKSEELRVLLPAFRFMALSATGRGSSGTVFGLTEDDRKRGTITRKRLDAPKRLQLQTLGDKETLGAALARKAWDLSTQGQTPIRCLIFSNERKVAQEAMAELQKLAKAASAADCQVELFVGGRRVYERQYAAERLEELGFIAGTSKRATGPAFVFATSAAEVGVDLDADHLVCDLVAWERMVQRLGRVNRRGERNAEVIVLRAPTKDPQLATMLDAVEAVLNQLPQLAPNGLDVSPGALTALKQRSAEDHPLQNQLTAASTPAPLHPPLTRPLLEAWSMTSLDVHTGRPDIEPWLRGWEVENEPQTTVVWRDMLPLNHQGQLLERSLHSAFLEAAPPQLIESLETETYHVANWVMKRLASMRSNTANSNEDHPSRLAKDQVVALLVSRDGSVSPLGLNYEDNDKRNRLEDRLNGVTLIVDARLGGLAHGLLDTDSDEAADIQTLVDDGQMPFRVSRTTTLQGPPSEERLRRELTIPIRISSSGDEEEWLTIDTWTKDFAETEDGRSVSAKRAQTLEEHETWAEQAAAKLAERVDLSSRFAHMLVVAARLHDEGKRSKRWQRAFRSPKDFESSAVPLAKTTTRPNLQILAGYRHEVGSLPHAEKHERFLGLSDAERDLCLHLIAAHHGRARPTIPIDGAEEPPSKLEERARQIALRFARLEKAWGPWGLAWWEALLRAADQQASRRNDEEGAEHG